MTTATKKDTLPHGASSLIALARWAHRDGNRGLEKAATDKLAIDYGIRIGFPCCESVDEDLERAGRRGRDDDKN